MKSNNRSSTKLPPLAMLRAFEAAARHKSMSRAATELNVTHGAISRQIVALERMLEFPLFLRRSRGVELTDAGARLFHGVLIGFDRIRATIEDLLSDQTRRRVTVTTLPTLASRWLMPQLADFQEEHPLIDISVRTAVELDDLTDPGIDFAIRYGRGAWPNTASELLLCASSYPVCSAEFLEKFGPIETPSDLANAPLIHNVTRQWWIDWFVAAGAKIGSLNGGIVVDEYGLAIQFATDGHGATLARGPLLDRELESRALLRLFDVAVTPHFAYYIVWDRGRRLHSEAELLIQWLKSRAHGRANRSPIITAEV